MSILSRVTLRRKEEHIVDKIKALEREAQDKSAIPMKPTFQNKAILTAAQLVAEIAQNHSSKKQRT